MKICAYRDCSKIIERTSSKANNKKYCSPECRQNEYDASGKTKEIRDKANHSKYNKYAKGKQQCVLCQGWYWAVCHHATQAHNINEREYKEMIGKDHKKGLITPDLKELRARQVVETGTINNLKKGIHNRYKKGDRVGTYKRSAETMQRLRNHIKTINNVKVKKA